jgi:cell division protein FtsN
MQNLRSPMAMIGAIVVAVILAVIGVYYQISPHNSAHAVSYHALAFWAAAVAALIGASFLRPPKTG